MATTASGTMSPELIYSQRVYLPYDMLCRVFRADWRDEISAEPEISKDAFVLRARFTISFSSSTVGYPNLIFNIKRSI